jgi:hypothetical protein
MSPRHYGRATWNETVITYSFGECLRECSQAFIIKDWQNLQFRRHWRSTTLGRTNSVHEKPTESLTTSLDNDKKDNDKKKSSDSLPVSCEGRQLVWTTAAT